MAKKTVISKLLDSKIYGELVYDACSVMIDVMPFEDITIEMILSEVHHYIYDVLPCWMYSEISGLPIVDDDEMYRYREQIRKGKMLIKKHNYHFDGDYPHLEYMDNMDLKE